MRHMITRYASTEKPFPPLAPREFISFTWRRDGKGYDWSPQGGAIVRRNGPMEDVPLHKGPPLHLVFARLRGQIWESDAGAFPGTDTTLPFPLRWFPDYENALLNFVREFGFLGAPPAGRDDASAEELSYIAYEQFQLDVFMAFAFTQADGHATPESELAECFNKAAPPLTLHMVRAPAGGYRVALRPQSLIAWMWLHAAYDFAERGRYGLRNCKWCGKTFTVAGTPRPGVKRDVSDFCSDNCRKSHWRKNKAKPQKRKPKERKS